MKRVLVPIDFSESSLNALKFGIQIANKLQASLRVVHVRNKKLAQKYLQHKVQALLNDDVEVWLDDVIKEYKESYRVLNGVFDSKILEGNVFKEISNQAKYDDTTLIVIGTHGASGFEDKYIGSNAFRLVNASTVPVLTVRPERDWRGIDKVILPVTMHKSSRQKVPAVVGLAKLFDAKVHVVGLKENGFSLLESRVNSFVKQTVKFIEKNTDLKVESEILTGKVKSSLLMDYAAKIDADVLATNVNHSSTPFENFFKPFANELINESACPVLVVPTKESLSLYA